MARRLRLIIIGFGLLVVIFTAVQAQQPNSPGDDSCSALVELALQEVGNNCAGVARNSACYGYDRVDASFAVEVEESIFSQPADRTELIKLDSIQTAPMDLEAERWGVALLNVQANVPNTLPGQAVTFILMGDVVLENEVSPDEAFASTETIDITTTITDPVNIRSGPSTFTNIVGAADTETIMAADGLSPDGGWVRVSLEETNGWISRQLVQGEGIDALPTVSEGSRTPMQAFYFTTGIGSPQCEDAPDVLLVQSPDNISVDLTINGAEINIGSTIALTNTSVDYNNASSDDELSGLFRETLLGKNVDDGADCQVTEMVMLEGSAILNDRSSILALGHGIRSVSCRDEEGNVAFTTPWRGSRRLSQEELNNFSVVQQLPGGIVSKQVSIPSEEEIVSEIGRLFPNDPTPTPEGDDEPEVTATPTIEDSPPIEQPTEVPPEVTDEP